MRRQPDRDNADHARARNARRRPLRLVLEPLEGRRLLAGLNVAVFVDQDGSRSTGLPIRQLAQRSIFGLKQQRSSRFKRSCSIY